MNNEIYFECELENGIHARPASHLKAQCEQFESQITLINLRNNNTADCKSVLALVSTDSIFHDNCKIEITGQDSEQAVKTLSAYIKNEFPFCDEKLESVASEEVVLPQSLMRHQPTLLHGTSLATGIAKGLLIPYNSVDLSIFACAPEGQEEARFHNAHQQVSQHITHALNQAQHQEKEILNTHLDILNDTHFIQPITTLLSTDSTANAILQVFEEITEKLAQASSAYLRERVLDIQDVVTQLLCAAYPEVQCETSLTLSQDSIVIASNLTPSQFLGLDKKHLTGLILTHAGNTSHTIILARAFNIPTLSGIEQKQCQSALQQAVFLDSHLAVLAIEPSNNVSHYFERAISLGMQQAAKERAFADHVAQTKDGVNIEIGANIACAIEAAPAFKKGAEAIGLFRTEMLYMDRSEAPNEEEQVATYRDVLTAADDKTVIIRTMDIGGDKPIDYLNLPTENNPFLGYRAVRIYPAFIALFHTQLKAILRAAEHGNAKIMIPMIQSIEEIRWVKEQISLVKAQLTEQQIPFNNDVPLGIMVEIPSVAYIIDLFCKEVDFFSIGSNDMTQYLLAVDRDNDSVSHLYNSLTPAFLRMLKQVVSTAQAHQCWVGLCGELGADANALPLLVGAGLNEISMSAPNIALTKSRLNQLDSKDCRQLFEQACQCATTAEIEQLLENGRQSFDNKAILSTECVLNNATFANKEEAIQAMVGNLGLTERCENRYLLEQDVWAREAVFSTALGHGFAIPHTKSEHIQHSSISIAKLTNPIDWQSDSGEVDFIIMLTLNKSHGDQHMRIFSSLARKLIHSSFREQLKQGQDAQAIVSLLEAELAI